MSTSLAVTVVGNDRPGIVAGIAHVLYDFGCNLEDATSTILRGHFSMMLVVDVPDDTDQSDLESRLSEAGESLGVTATVGPLEEASAPAPPPTHMVSVYGGDRPGIVFRVAERLSERSINITDLTSRVIGEGTTPVYALMLEVAAPAGADVESDLAAIREQLGVEVSVRALDADLF